MKSSKLTDRLLLGFSKIIHVTQTYLVYLEKIKNQHEVVLRGRLKAEEA